MSAPTWRGFVINQTETTYTVLSERDKQLHTLQKKNNEIITGCVVMSDGHICNIDDYVFNNSMLYSACREYTGMLKRHKKRRAEKKSIKELTTLQTATVDFII
jgi:hypothetical protein